MALKKEDKIRLEGLEQTLTMLTSSGIEKDAIEKMMETQISDFQKITNTKVKLNFESKPSIDLLDLKKDFVRTREPNSETQVLRAKIEGVGIDAKLFKQEEYIFSNSDVVSALRALADEVEKLPLELNTLGVSDVRELEVHEELDDQVSDDDDSMIADLDDKISETMEIDDELEIHENDESDLD